MQEGVHIAERNNQLPEDMVQLLKSQDYNYIRTQRGVSKKVWIIIFSILVYTWLFFFCFYVLCCFPTGLYIYIYTVH